MSPELNFPEGIQHSFDVLNRRISSKYGMPAERNGWYSHRKNGFANIAYTT